MTQKKHSTDKVLLNVELGADLIQFVNERAAAEGKAPSDYIVNLLDQAIKQRKKNKIEIPADLRDELERICPDEMPVNLFVVQMLKNAIEHRQILSEVQAGA
jgi:hypothetical protein